MERQIASEHQGFRKDRIRIGRFGAAQERGTQPQNALALSEGSIGGSPPARRRSPALNLLAFKGRGDQTEVEMHR